VAQEGAKKKSRSDDSRVANGMPLQVDFPEPHSTCDHLLERRAATNSPEIWMCAEGGLRPGQAIAAQRGAMRAVIHSMDPDMSMNQPRALADFASEAISQPRFRTIC
jgi:hypothetical protein